VVQIVIFGMIAAFLGLRLYMVLGKRTGAEQPLHRAEEAKVQDIPALVPAPEAREALPAQHPLEAPVEPQAAAGLRQIANADSYFDAYDFVHGAQGAYREVLEAYWKGDEAQLAKLADPDVCEAFGEAIKERAAAGQTLDNRLVRIERAVISHAELDGRIAKITVRFDADIAAVTRDKDGKVIAGSLTDAVPTHDVWVFSRDVKSNDPNWHLIDTDEAV
jgi:predicted lipid-binding transport protein (Tim44 family)